MGECEKDYGYDFILKCLWGYESHFMGESEEDNDHEFTLLNIMNLLVRNWLPVGYMSARIHIIMQKVC